MNPEALQIVSNVPAQASNDAQVIELWLHDRPTNTKKAYEQHLGKFQIYITEYMEGFNLKRIQLGMLQAFQDWLNKECELKPKSIQCHMSTVKSLFTFAHRIGYIQFNPAAVIKLRKPKDTLAQRLLSRSEVIKMIDAETNPRNKALMRLLYVSGIRSSEAINLKACDLLAHDSGGQITVTAKGGKTLAVWIDQTTWEMIQDCCGTVEGHGWNASEKCAELDTQRAVLDASSNETNINQVSNPDRSVFQTSTGRPLPLSHVWKIVRAAAKRSGLSKPVSPHWLRHATATHLMDAGVSLVAIKEHLGHETISTTTRYTHVKPSAANAKLLAW